MNDYEKDAQVLDDVFDLLAHIKRHFDIPEAKYIFDDHKFFLKPLFEKYDTMCDFINAGASGQLPTPTQKEHYNLRVAYAKLEDELEDLKSKHK